MNLKAIILPLFLFFISVNSFSRTHFKIPKQYSIEAGYRNLFGSANITNKNTHGYGALFDYAWQLSGFDQEKAASFISVPLGYTVLLPDDGTSETMYMLNYGWTVRHELKKKSNIMPFVAYGLLLNNMRLQETEGSVFGHQTQFEFGFNFNTKTRLKYFAKIQYSYTSYPRFHEPERIRLHFVDLRAGIRF